VSATIRTRCVGGWKLRVEAERTKFVDGKWREGGGMKVELLRGRSVGWV